MKKHLASIAFISLACLSAFAQKATQKFPKFDTEAHRGGRGLMPENTIPAMLNAIDLGVTTLEMDTHITADGKVILSHDDTLNPLFTLTPDGKEMSKDEAHKQALLKMNYADIAKFDVGSKPYSKFPEQKKVKVHIPLLEAVIDSVQQYLKAKGKPQVYYNIETKSKPGGDNIYHPAPAEFVKQLMEVIERKEIIHYVIIQSFDKRTIQFLHKKYPQVKTAYLVDIQKSVNEYVTELGYKPYIISPAYKLVTANMIQQCHAQGIKIVPWTVNTSEEIAALKALGVDGIISDYPDLLEK
ncbi:glycerophosphodiester phosphodiesterase family protein [Mucilaginibacter aquatilis]|uniref:Glycerophosphodiester phosphodiesterase n=1 Tax=Mucilaginibacter aquatilis TaxID=1517760 RepID=A0A6I4IQR1_9SPHI|nr:glycerophosphodiester phosphodiesterase family protein [Mucilaginibacter aquatilis]MVN92143.1 glycerophosphodiester phosphodiesterase [Mucilaginibacter aquatilis]